MTAEKKRTRAGEVRRTSAATKKRKGPPPPVLDVETMLAGGDANSAVRTTTIDLPYGDTQATIFYRPVSSRVLLNLAELQEAGESGEATVAKTFALMVDIVEQSLCDEAGNRLLTRQQAEDAPGDMIGVIVDAIAGANAARKEGKG